MPPGEAMKLEGAVIAVTGGASGLGESTVELCVARGAKVAAPRRTGTKVLRASASVRCARTCQMHDVKQ